MQSPWVRHFPYGGRLTAKGLNLQRGGDGSHIRCTTILCPGVLVVNTLTSAPASLLSPSASENLFSTCGFYLHRCDGIVLCVICEYSISNAVYGVRCSIIRDGDYGIFHISGIKDFNGNNVVIPTCGVLGISSPTESISKISCEVLAGLFIQCATLC